MAYAVPARVVLLTFAVVEGIFSIGFTVFTDEFVTSYGMNLGELPVTESMIAINSMSRAGVFDGISFAIVISAALCPNPVVQKNTAVCLVVVAAMWALNIILYWDTWTSLGTKPSGLRFGFYYNILLSVLAALAAPGCKLVRGSRSHGLWAWNMPWIAALIFFIVSDFFFFDASAKIYGADDFKWTESGWAYYKLFCMHTQVPAMATCLLLVVAAYASRDTGYMYTISRILTVGGAGMFLFVAARRLWWKVVQGLPESWVQGQTFNAFLFAGLMMSSNYPLITMDRSLSKSIEKQAFGNDSLLVA